MRNFDCVVVGAGINGLAAAVHLSSRGWKVAVVEKNPVAEGAVRTEEITSPGFRHDLFAMNVSLFAGSAFYRTHKAALDAQGLEFVPVTNTFASVFPDGRWLGVSTDIEQTCALISEISPADATQWRAMAEAFPLEAAFIGGILSTPMPSIALVRLVLGTWRKHGFAWMRNLARLLLSSPRAFLNTHFESNDVRALMSAWSMHLDFAPDTAGGAVFPYLESFGCQNFGMALGKGGADAIVRAMVAALTSSGGELILGAEVAEIEKDRDRASAVLLKSGERITARRAVIANVHPRNLATKLVPSMEPRFSKAAQDFRPGPATLMMHLALDSLPHWAAGTDLQRFAYVHVAHDYAAMSRAYQDAVEGLIPSSPVVVVGQPTALDPSRAPAGKHILWLQVRAVPYEIKGDADGAIQARDWSHAAEPFGERILDIVEEHAPGLRSQVISNTIFSPVDLERMNPNLVEGDSLGGSHHLDQNFLFRPFGGWSRWRTPVRGLYMVGASTWPGAGTGVGSGFMLAQELAK